MKLTEQQESMIRIGALVLPGMIVSTWVSDVVGDGDFAMAGVGGLVAAILIGVGYFLFHKRSLKVQAIASLSVTVLLFAAIGISMNTSKQKMKREILGRWESVPRENELDEPMTMWFTTTKKVHVGFEDPHQCEYEITSDGELALTENMKTSRMKIVLLRNDSLQLATEEGTVLFVRN